MVKTRSGAQVRPPRSPSRRNAAPPSHPEDDLPPSSALGVIALTFLIMLGVAVLHGQDPADSPSPPPPIPDSWKWRPFGSLLPY